MISGVSGLNTSYDTSSAAAVYSTDSMAYPQLKKESLKAAEKHNTGNLDSSYNTQSLQKDDAVDAAQTAEEKTKEKEQEQLSEDQVSEMSEELNKFMREMNADIQFNYSKKLDRLSMKVVDRKTDEVLKEFPPEKMIKVLEGIHDWIGMILDEKA